jgi:hypothetical protein
MSDEPATDDHDRAEARGYEVRDVSGTNVVIIVLASALFVAVMLGMVTLVGTVWQLDDRGVGDVAEWEISPPGAPALQVEPAKDMVELKAANEAKLNAYGWIDEDAGIAHIPIDEAKRLVVERAREREAGLGTPR